MNGARIMNLLSRDSSTKNLFFGFLSPDTSINIEHFPALVIINTDEITGRGEHWCVAFYRNRNVCEFFDPLGFSPNNKNLGYNLVPNLFENCLKKIEFNKKQVQAFDAETCGHHCVYFSFLRANNIPMLTILNNYYTNEPAQNDSKVFSIIENVQT
jgi:hypothetical protein